MRARDRVVCGRVVVEERWVCGHFWRVRVRVCVRVIQIWKKKYEQWVTSKRKKRGKNISRTDYVVFVPMESLATTTKNLNKKALFSSRLAKVMRKLRDMWKWKSEQTSSNTHAIALISILRTSSMISTRVRSRSHHHAHPLKVTKKRMSLPWTLQKDVVTH